MCLCWRTPSVQLFVQVKGCTGTYLWGPDELARMDEVGNVEAEKRYGSHKIDPSASKEQAKGLACMCTELKRSGKT